GHAPRPPLHSSPTRRSSDLGVLLAAGDSGGPVAAGRYPVADPGAGPLPRPGAALALRMPGEGGSRGFQGRDGTVELAAAGAGWEDRKSTRLNSSHVKISYAV